MKKWIFIFAIISMPCVSHGAFKEFYTDYINGDNRNAGDGTSLIIDNGGSWDSVTSSYTASSGTPFSTTTVGQYISIFQTPQSTTSFVACIASVGGSGSFVIVYSTMSGGTIPVTGSGFSARTGGMWRGLATGSNEVNGAIPWNIYTTSMTDLSGNGPCINVHNNAVYITTYVIVIPNTASSYGSNNIILRVEGYSNTPHDGGIAVIANIVAGPPVVISQASSGWSFNYLTIQTTAATGGTNPCISLTNSNNLFTNMSIHGCRGAGLTSSVSSTLESIEIYDSNKSNSANVGMLNVTGTTFAKNIFIHDGTAGSNVTGVRIGALISMDHFIISNVAGNCFQDVNGGVAMIFLSNGACYNPTLDGMRIDNAGVTLAQSEIVSVENTYFVKNGGYAHNFQGSGKRVATYFNNNAYFQNTSGIVNGTCQFNRFKEISLNSDPFFNSASGDFRTKSAQGLGTGYGTFVTLGSTVAAQSYLDVGAIQSKRFPGGGLTVSN